MPLAQHSSQLLLATSAASAVNGDVAASTSTKTTTTTVTTPLLTSSLNSEAKKGDKKAIATGMDRYLTISKRKRSPQGEKIKTQSKKNKTKTAQAPLNAQNRFALLAHTNDIEASVSKQASKELKPPPIYVRERNSNAFVSNLTRLVGNGNFFVVPLTRGNLHETKIQVNTEAKYRDVVKDLEANGKKFYTYQLKSSKGISAVIKGIEPDVDPEEIKEALGDSGFHVKAVINIVNRNKVPQPMFKVDLLANTQILKKNEVHPIYKLQFLLHRRVTVEPPHPRNGPVQCTNCQEFGHTQKYCTLCPVCVVCGELHRTSECPKKGLSDKNVIKCGNCNENHTANYRGCKVYQHLKQTIALKKQALRNPTKNPFTTAEFISQRLPATPVVPSVSFASALKSSALNQQQQPVQSNNNLCYLCKQCSPKCWKCSPKY